MRTRVKVCCIASHEEAATAIRHGADVLGLVGPMPSGPGPIDDALIAEIASAVPAGVSTFLLTSRTEPEEIVAHARAARATAVQIVDSVPERTYDLLRRELPALRIVQVLHVEDSGVLDQARAIERFVDAILLDSGRPKLAVPELGGTGRVHDWRISGQLAREIHRPVFLAGGLNASNAAAAIREVRPFALDVCSGVRTDGRLDEAKLGAFFASVRRADQLPPQTAPEPGR